MFMRVFLICDKFEVMMMMIVFKLRLIGNQTVLWQTNARSVKWRNGWFADKWTCQNVRWKIWRK